MPQIKIGDTVLSFDNTTGKMVVLRTEGVCEWTHEPCALCRCLENHPHGYKKGDSDWYGISELKKV